jgi:phage/plasmid-like protein (TIGR03299 family)
MAHDLNFNNGRWSMYSLREVPWHQLGQVVEQPVISDEVKRLAGLDWNVELEPLLRQDMSPLDTHVATIRSDNRRTLGVVTKGYVPVQNSALFDWLKGLDGFADVTIETAGALGNGETVWVMARCNGLAYDLGDGGTMPYMLLSNGHAGNRRVHIMPTTVRVVCANTLRAATEGRKRKILMGKDTITTADLSNGFALRHTANVNDAMKRVQEAYASTTNAWKATEEAMRFLASKELTRQNMAKLLVETFTEDASDDDEEPKDEGERAAEIRRMREDRLAAILDSKTCAIGKLAGTAYAGLQALTEYIDHELPTQIRGEYEDRNRAIGLRRLASTNFGGDGDKLKSRAFGLAMALADQV